MPKLLFTIEDENLSYSLHVEMPQSLVTQITGYPELPAVNRLRHSFPNSGEMWDYAPSLKIFLNDTLYSRESRQAPRSDSFIEFDQYIRDSMTRKLDIIPKKYWPMLELLFRIKLISKVKDIPIPCKLMTSAKISNKYPEYYKGDIINDIILDGLRILNLQKKTMNRSLRNLSWKPIELEKNTNDE